MRSMFLSVIPIPGGVVQALVVLVTAVQIRQQPVTLSSGHGIVTIGGRVATRVLVLT